MRVPHKIRITSKISYEILYADVIKDDPTCHGHCCPEKKQIILKNGLSDSNIAKALIHEIIHCAEFETKTPIPHKITYALEEGFYKMLKLNKWI